MPPPDAEAQDESEHTAGAEIRPLASAYEHPPQADAATEKRGGLYDGFETYCTPSDADYRSLLTSGMVVVDTNVLLDLYRHNMQTRDVLLSVLGRLREQLWVPHQVMAEFWRHREEVLQDRRGTIKIINDLRAQRAKAADNIHTWANRAALPKAHPAEMVEVLSDAFKTVIHRIGRHADPGTNEFARNTDKDPVLIGLGPILEGRVGPPLSEKDHAEAVEEGRQRGKTKRPPGYVDVGPEGKGPTGDYVLWAQILQEAQQRHLDVLFVTGDNKEDWWRYERKEQRGPRPELVEEIRNAAGVRLFMLRPDELLTRGRQVLQVDVPDESVQAVKRVSSTAFVPWEDTDAVRAVRTRMADELEEQAAWRQAIAEQYPDDPRNIRSVDALHGLARYVRERPDDDMRLVRTAATIRGDTSLIGAGENWHEAFDQYGFHEHLDPSSGLDMLADAIEADHPEKDRA